MAGKPSRARIAAEVADLDNLLEEAEIRKRIKAIKCRQARKNINAHLDELVERFEAGDSIRYPNTTTALGRSIVRFIEGFEEGYYEKGLKDGGFQVRGPRKDEL